MRPAHDVTGDEMKIDWQLHVDNPMIQRLVERVRKAMYEAAYAAAVEILDEMEQDLNKIYYTIIKEFYADYSPVFYDRTGSLYDLLQIKNTGENLNWYFETDNATAFERGGGKEGLYEHVFRQGWHGGATGTDKHGYTVTTPSWRQPIPWYSNWGSVAEQAPRSPLEAWDQEVDAYKTDVLPQRYNALYHRHLQKYGFR